MCDVLGCGSSVPLDSKLSSVWSPSWSAALTLELCDVLGCGSRGPLDNKLSSVWSPVGSGDEALTLVVASVCRGSSSSVLSSSVASYNLDKKHSVDNIRLKELSALLNKLMAQPH